MTKQLSISALITAAVFALASCGDKGPNGAKGAVDFCVDFSGSGNYSLKNFRNGPDYVINCDIDLSSGTIEIEPGTEILVDVSKTIVISGTGALKATGTTSAPISFLPKDGNSSLASWGGIVISSSNPATLLEHVIIDRAGTVGLDQQMTGANYYPQNEVLAGLVSCGKGSFNNITIRNSGGAGLVIGYYSSATFSGIRVENSKYYPLMTEGNRMMQLNPVFTFVNSSPNKIGCWIEGFYTELVDNGSWKDLGYPVSLTTNIAVSSNAEFAEGLELELDNDRMITVNGSLKISGSAANPVVIRGSSAVKGWWKGIQYLSTSNLNTISNLVLSDAGSNKLEYVNTEAGIVSGNGLGGTGKLVISNSEIRNTTGCGLLEISGSTLTHSNMNYSNTDNGFCQE